MSAQLNSERRKQLERMLTTRAEILSPKRDTIAQALRRCIKHEAQQGEAPSVVPAAQISKTEELSNFNADSLIDSSGTDDLRVATAVAGAQTVQEDGVEEDAPAAPRNSGPIPAVIRRGKERIRGLAPGSVVAGYRIEGILGVGGMGQVYRATQISMSREVAFKVLAPRLADNESFRRRFVREARNAGRLAHPNLIAVHDVGEAEKLLFFSMELVEGESVKKLIKRSGTVDETRALAITRECLQALKYAHNQGIIHRDIKPDNLMITTNGMVKVADLGLSRLEEADDDSSVTQSGTMMGTPFYMAPEQGRDARIADARSDIYAVGATLYHMVCGQVPFTGSSPMDVLVRAATTPLEFPSPGPSKALRQLLHKLLEKDPEERAQSAVEAIELIDQMGALGTTPASVQIGTEPTRIPNRPRKKSSFLPWIVAAVVAVVLTALIAGAVQAGAQKSWQNQREAVGSLIGEDKFSKALENLDNFLSNNPEFRADAAPLRSLILDEWDAFTAQQLDGIFQAIDDLIFDQKFAEAQRRINELRNDGVNLSPWTRERLDLAESNLRQAQGGGNSSRPAETPSDAVN